MPARKPRFGQIIRVKSPTGETLYSGPERRGGPTSRRRSHKGKTTELLIRTKPLGKITMRDINTAMVRINEGIREKAAADSSYRDLPEAAWLRDLAGKIREQRLTPSDLPGALAKLKTIIKKHGF